MSTNTSIVVQQTQKLARFFDIPESGELVDVLKATAFKGQVSDAQMSALLIVANQYKLNPWTKEIYAFPDKNNGIVPVVGVDGWARIINEHPQFDGIDFEQNEESCTAIIYRKDRSHPVKITEYMSECKRGTGPWQSHPKRMLRHKAMIQGARIAFGYGGIYDQDEAEVIVEKDINSPPSRPEVSMPRGKSAQAKPEQKASPAGNVIDHDTGEVMDKQPAKTTKPAATTQTPAGQASTGMLNFIRNKAKEKDIPEEVICAEHDIESLDGIDEAKANTIINWIKAR
jgi:phage recombination protein Bet